MGSILIGFLYAVLYCAVVILIAFAFVWAFKWIFNRDIDPDVKKWGTIVVGLICLIVLLTWLLTALGMLGGGPYFGPRFLK